MYDSMNPPSSNTTHSNATQSPGMGLPPSNEPMAVLTVLVLFGMVCIAAALSMRYCPTPATPEGREETESVAAIRRERERKRSEYVHKVLKTRSWHRGKGSVEPSKLPPSSANIGDNALTIPSGDSGGGDDELTPVEPPYPIGLEECPELESGPQSQPPGDDRDAVESESESNLCPSLAPASPCGSVKEGEEDDDVPECAICLCPFEESERVCEANNASCRHVFHQECLEPWLLRHEHCPVCREAYLRRPGRGTKGSKRRNA
jgi:Ring finger domain